MMIQEGTDVANRMVRLVVNQMVLTLLIQYKSHTLAQSYLNISHQNNSTANASIAYN